jgi:hypothetical protein
MTSTKEQFQALVKEHAPELLTLDDDENWAMLNNFQQALRPTLSSYLKPPEVLRVYSLDTFQDAPNHSTHGFIQINFRASNKFDGPEIMGRTANRTRCLTLYFSKHRGRGMDVFAEYETDNLKDIMEALTGPAMVGQTWSDV